MLFLFSGALQARTAPIAIDATARAALAAEAAQLGAATVPPAVSAAAAAAVQSAIRLAFVDAFRVVMLVCTGLSWIGAALAGLLVERRFKAAA